MDASLNLKGLRKEMVSRADPEAKRKLEVGLASDKGAGR